MTSTSFNIGMSTDRSSSRVLKPPGGGHTNLFGEGEVQVKVNSPRPKYDQQNSSNLNFCMNTVDPNLLVENLKHEVEASHQAKAPEPKPSAPVDNGNSAKQQASDSSRGRVPPGGFSSGGFW